MIQMDHDTTRIIHCEIVDPKFGGLRYHLHTPFHVVPNSFPFFQGVSRSAAIVIAYLIRNQGLSYEKALDLVKRKRACVKPNAGFVRALQEWESSITGKRPPATRRSTS